MQKLYFECYSGISGDMIVASLIDLGVPSKKLVEALKTIPVKGFDIKISRVKKSGLDVCDFDVVLDTKHENHDHDMKYLHHNSDYQHPHGKHRGIKEIYEIIDNTKISDKSKKIAKNIFDVLATSEAKVHGVKKEEVHFHEVGAIDSIVDIIAISCCIDYLKIDNIISSPLCEGKGFIRHQHGLIPVPAPATCNIVKDYNLPIHIIDVYGELVTPTGAATIAALKKEDNLPDKYKIIGIGMGNGKRKYETPGILRAMIIEE